MNFGSNGLIDMGAIIGVMAMRQGNASRGDANRVSRRHYGLKRQNEPRRLIAGKRGMP
jgi:hypothetical protein